jgi:hypothetical protein
MRHEQLKRPEDFDVVEISVNDGPAAPAIAELELGRAPSSQSAVPEMPAAVGRLIVAAYVGLIGVLALTMARNASSAFVIAIDVAFVVAFLAVPAIFLGVEKDSAVRPGLGRFLSEGVQTATGHLSGSGALVQMLVVPVLLTLGLLVIGITGLIIL